jgi:MATE family multidrug resistance protein
MGAAGCGWSTAIVMWFACLSSLGLWVTEKRYARLKTSGVLGWPRWDLLKSLFMMGLPIGGAYLIEVTAFTMVAVLVARFGIEIVAGHQIVSNLTATAYMLPLSLANATTVLTAQQLGASNPERARLFVLTGLKTAVVCALVVVGFYALLSDLIIGAYTSDAGTRAIAFELLPWILAYHLIDATQTLCAFALRAYGISTTPTLIYGVCLWGFGLGGGIILGIWNTPPLMAQGFWMASVGSLLVAGILLAGLLWRAMRRG